MLLRYLYDDNLAQASYIVGCQATGEALVIDPNRLVEEYIEIAEQEGLRITAVTETHIHADFVSGARELAHRTGATLYLSDEGGPDWSYGFDHHGLRDGDKFMVGNIKLQVLHSPGHTPEHISFVLTDTAGADEPMGVFTGDFVFVGDIGRPDLLETAAGVAASKEPAARAMFASVTRFKDMPDYLQIWPGHGAGSACGKALGAIPSSTLGYERRFNWAFQITDEEAFVTQLLDGQPEPPRYFAQMKRINRDGAPILHGLPAPDHLTCDRLQTLLDDGATVVDTRNWAAFATTHIPGTVSVPLDYSFANWAGALLPYDEPLYLIVDEHHQAEALGELIRIGLDNVGGVVRPAILDQWPGEHGHIAHADVRTFKAKLDAGEIVALDVRLATEYAEGHVPGVPNLALQRLVDHMDLVPNGKPLYLYCRTGHRSALAASYVRSRGITDVVNVSDGITAWSRAGLPIEKGGV